MKLALFGGTFDPIHRGHVEVADECALKLELDQVLMIPSYLPPHRDPPLASAEDRLEMVRLAVVGHDRLVASDIEVRRQGVSYTIDTIRAQFGSGSIQRGSLFDKSMTEPEEE